MLFQSAFTASMLLVSGAFAQYPAPGASTNIAAGSASSASTSMPGMVDVQVVKVSNKNGSLTFSPNNIVAAAGSMVQFHFYPKNHSVVQSTFDNPCTPINNIQSNVTGLFSGFMPVSGDQMPVFTVPINDTKPIWFYCSQGKHCQAGMVGVINAPAANLSRTVETYAAGAAMASANLSPGEVSSSTSSSGYGSSSSGSTTGSSSTGVSTGYGSGTGSGSGSAPSSAASGTSAGGSSSAGTATTSSGITLATNAATGMLAGSREQAVAMAAAGFVSYLAFAL